MPISERSHCSHRTMSSRTKRCLWSMLGAAWKRSPVLRWPAPPYSWSSPQMADASQSSVPPNCTPRRCVTAGTPCAHACRTLTSAACGAQAVSAPDQMVAPEAGVRACTCARSGTGEGPRTRL